MRGTEEGGERPRQCGKVCMYMRKKDTEEKRDEGGFKFKILEETHCTYKTAIILSQELGGLSLEK